jgi:hypothetical protein
MTGVFSFRFTPRIGIMARQEQMAGTGPAMTEQQLTGQPLRRLVLSFQFFPPHFQFQPLFLGFR